MAAREKGRPWQRTLDTVTELGNCQSNRTDPKFTCLEYCEAARRI